MSDSFIVTGAGGFIGARMVEALRLRGSDVVAVDRPETFARPEHRGIDFGTTIDIEDLASFLEGDGGKQARAVIHLGACTDTMEMDEALLAKLNLDYSRMLWSFCARRGVPLVYASSAATYGAGERGYVDDESRISELHPLNPYGWSKQRFDMWALDQERTGVHPPRWAGFKFFNVYGFGERHKGRMASVVLHGFDQIRAEAKIRLFKSYKAGVRDGEQKRDFVYVGDVVEVILFACAGSISRGIYNLGTGRARSFADLARATFEGMKIQPRIDYIEMPEALRERYQYFTEADTTRLRQAGYTTPFTSLEQGVAAYVERLLRT
jgi:ADP-L-glycero-D-manno-heptose 6-epimerase